MNWKFVEYVYITARFVFMAIIVVLLARTFVVSPGKVNGRSMEPTMIDNEFFLVSKSTLLLRSPRRGDIVQLVSPTEESNELLVKRIIGLPGEQVMIRQNGVFIKDGDAPMAQLEEPYVTDGATRSADKKAATYDVLGEHEYFVLGDNRSDSGDSRHFGSVHRSHIIGPVVQVPTASD